MDLYSVDYVRSLEHRLADMEGRPHHQMPTHGLQPLPVPPMVTPQNKPGDVQVNVAPSIDTMQPQQQIFQPPINELDPQPAFSQAFAEPDYISSTPLQGAADYTENAGNTLASGDIDFTFTLTPPRTVPRQPDDVPVSTSDAASYFFVYFEVIHSRYPFLRIQDCSSAYLDWKEHRQLPGSFQSTWHLFLVTMIFAIGTRIEQSHNSRARRAQRLSLVARIDSVQGIISDSQSSPLMRLQALLLYVVFAMLGDSTFGLVHVTGIAMRFATLHGFHRLRSSSEAENEEMSLKSRAWSCIYAIDRMISGTLRIPVCVADPEISSPLYEGQTLSLETMPWVADSPESDTQTELVDLTYFSHMIQFRHIQSKIIHGAPSLQPGQVQGFIEYIDHEIKEWSKENEASTRTQRGDEGYFSHLWLDRSISIVEVQLYSTLEDLTDPVNVHRLFQACCNACNAFRAAQKSRQLIRQWIDTIFEFQAGVTLLYLMWRGNAPNWQEAERAVRNCRSGLVISAEGSSAVECFLDCIDNLVSLVSGGPLEILTRTATHPETIQELKTIVDKVIDIGIAPHISNKLREMCQQSFQP